MQRKAFTFIELIVVLIFLAILAAILVPVFTRRPSPHRSPCQVNLKQITLGFKQYTQDANELFPRYNVGNVGSSSSGSLTATHWVQSLQPYTKSLQIFQCPSEDNSVGTDYYYSRVVSGRNETDFNNSANTVLLAEGTDTANGALATATAPVKTGTPPAYSRHLDGSNYAFVDGHVKWLQSTRAPTNLSASGGGFTFQS